MSLCQFFLEDQIPAHQDRHHTTCNPREKYYLEDAHDSDLNESKHCKQDYTRAPGDRTPAAFNPEGACGGERRVETQRLNLGTFL